MNNGVMCRELTYNEHEHPIETAAKFMNVKELEFQIDNACKKEEVEEKSWTKKL